jgi:hypothetical protein
MIAAIAAEPVFSQSSFSFNYFADVIAAPRLVCYDWSAARWFGRQSGDFRPTTHKSTSVQRWLASALGSAAALNKPEPHRHWHRDGVPVHTRTMR